MTAPALPDTFWVTRGRTGGELDDRLEVWAVRPQRIRCDDGDVMWLAPDEHLMGIARSEAWIDAWTPGEAQLKIGNGYPGTDLECVRVGPEPIVSVPENVS